MAGGERYLHDLIRHSSGSITHKIILPADGPFARMLESSGCQFKIVPLKYSCFLRSLSCIIRTIDKDNIDIVHTHSYRANFYGRVACHFTKVKHMATVHVSLFDYRQTPTPLRFCYILVESMMSFMTCKFICVSKAMAGDSQKMMIPRRKIVVMHNGVDLKRFYPRKISAVERMEFGIEANTRLIGTAGRIVPEKGQIFLLKALACMRSEGNRLKCLFLGEGPLLPFLKQKAGEFGILDMCIFAGVRENIEMIYPMLDLFVLPSLREPFGLALLEAMACSVPVVATASGGPLDFIRSGVNGELVPPRDSKALAAKISCLLENKQRALLLGEEGRKTVESRFSVTETTRKLDHLYSVL
jgi:glycosyltransferase involved in cell wall biosynthesis